jgi:hypothetical protein
VTVNTSGNVIVNMAAIDGKNYVFHQRHGQTLGTAISSVAGCELSRRLRDLKWSGCGEARDLTAAS